MHNKSLNINDFRTHDYRVFIAAPFFNIDLWHEISWHSRHLKILRNHAKKPHLFHQQFTDGRLDGDRVRHFKEHVLDSIPFHEKLLRDHALRLAAILSIIKKRLYKRLVDVSRKYGGTPEYFVVEKSTRRFFFVCDGLTLEKRRWIGMVRDQKKICDVVVVNK